MSIKIFDPHKRIYNSWLAFKQRCYYKKNKSYPDYGGKGIIVCDDWIYNYSKFLEDMGLCPSEKHVLTRIDSTKNFDKSNCVWMLVSDRNNSKSSSVNITYNGKTQNITMWATELGFSREHLVSRIFKLGWTVEEAFNTPVKKMNTGKKYEPSDTVYINDTSDNSYYVYHLINPITNRIFYVGKGKGLRCKQHLTDKQNTCHNTRLNGYIRNLVNSGNPPTIVKVLENVNEREAYEIEELQISLYGRVGYESGGILLNILSSGRPPVQKGKNHPWYGRKHSEESKQRMSESQKGHLMSEATILKMSKTYIVTSPDGVEQTITNLSKFCRDNGLCKSAMNGVAKGTSTHAKGWLCRELGDDNFVCNRKSKTKNYKITHPNGNIEIVNNLSKFCRKNNLRRSSLFQSKKWKVEVVE